MPESSFPTDRLLPEGVRDLLFADTAAWRGMEASLRQTTAAWGYREITLPTFEYARTLATDVGAAIDAEMYRFFDRQGHTLALRPDMTLPTARVVGSRLFDQPLPLRLSYAGSVFRYEPPRAGRQHEFSQFGIELIGAPGHAADAEAIALAVAALRAVGLPSFRITVGHVGFFRGLLAGLALPPALAGRLSAAIDRKAEAELKLLLKEAVALPPIARRAVLELPRLTGDAAMLADAERYCLNATMMQALVDLRAVADLLAAHHVDEAVHYDLSEARALDYYTGVTFEGFAPGLGFNLLSGGRYDDLLSHFGPPFPAVGWALTLDRVVEAREVQGVCQPEAAADLLLSPAGWADWVNWASQMRAAGLRVEVDPLGLTPEALWASAQARGIPRTLHALEPDHWQLRDAQGVRSLLGADLKEATSWLKD